MIGRITSTPIDDFLAGAGSGSASGARLEAIGAGLALGGLVLAVGLVVFLAVVHTGERAEVVRVLRFVAFAGALMLGGGILEVAGTADVLGLAWSDALTDGAASSAMMRLLGGVLVVLGFTAEVRPVGALGAPSGVPGTAASSAAVADTVRWTPGATSAFGLAGLTGGVLSFAFDGHTTTEGPRVLHAAVNAVHVVAGGVWFGGIVGLLVVGAFQVRAGSVGALVVSFSRLAAIALGTVFVAGVVMASMILDGVGDLADTDWGRRLLVKTSGVGAAAALGAYHRLVVVPRFDAGDASGERTARVAIAAEALVLALVVVMSTLLTRASSS